MEFDGYFRNQWKNGVVDILRVGFGYDIDIDVWYAFNFNIVLFGFEIGFDIINKNCN